MSDAQNLPLRERPIDLFFAVRLVVFPLLRLARMRQPLPFTRKF